PQVAAMPPGVARAETRFLLAQMSDEPVTSPAFAEALAEADPPLRAEILGHLANHGAVTGTVRLSQAHAWTIEAAGLTDLTDPATGHPDGLAGRLPGGAARDRPGAEAGPAGRPRRRRPASDARRGRPDPRAARHVARPGGPGAGPACQLAGGGAGARGGMVSRR